MWVFMWFFPWVTGVYAMIMRFLSMFRNKWKRYLTERKKRGSIEFTHISKPKRNSSKKNFATLALRNFFFFKSDILCNITLSSKNYFFSMHKDVIQKCLYNLFAYYFWTRIFIYNYTSKFRDYKMKSNVKSSWSM